MVCSIAQSDPNGVVADTVLSKARSVSPTEFGPSGMFVESMSFSLQSPLKDPTDPLVGSMNVVRLKLPKF